MTTQKTLRQSFLLTGLMLGLGASAASAQSVVYNETFQNTTGVDILTSTAGWQFWLNSGGVRVNQTASASNSSISWRAGRPAADLPVNSGPTLAQANGFVFISGVTSPLVYITQEYQNVNVADLTSVSFWQGSSYDAVGAPNAGMRVVLEIGGLWYASTQSNQQFIPGGGAGFSTQAVQKNLTLAGSTWELLTFTAGQAISIGASATLPTSGAITGFGIFANGPIASIRFDNFTLTAIPEPSTFAALAGAGVLGLAAFRRRRSAR